MSPTPPVSVVIPAYNRAGSLRASVDSVLGQSWPDFELLVVDDGSTDDTLAVARAIGDPRIRILSTPHNMGASGARNFGAAQARGDWIAFHDSDDIWLPRRLELQMARLAETGTGAGYCRMTVMGTAEDGGKANGVSQVPDPALAPLEGDILETVLRHSVISTQTLVLRRALFERLGGFDPDLRALVDWELAIRLAQAGPICFVPEAQVIQYFSDNSLTRSREKRLAARRRIVEIHHALFAARPDALLHQYRAIAGEAAMTRPPRCWPAPAACGPSIRNFWRWPSGCACAGPDPPEGGPP